MAGEKKSLAGASVELVGILVVAIGLALAVQAFLVKPFRIPSGSMIPTLSIGQRVLVDRIGERFTSPEIGRVMVFHPPDGADDGASTGVRGTACGTATRDGEACSRPTPRPSKQNFIKRVVAGPGDTVAVVDGHVVRNGRRQAEPFVQERCAAGAPADFPVPIRIPAGHWFMMGDNRQCSRDSRFWGPVPESSFVGGAFATYWPPKRIGLL